MAMTVGDGVAADVLGRAAYMSALKPHRLVLEPIDDDNRFCDCGRAAVWLVCAVDVFGEGFETERCSEHLQSGIASALRAVAP